MAGNKSLKAAVRAKEDEFYTQLTDIEKERDHFKQKGWKRSLLFFVGYAPGKALAPFHRCFI